MKKKDQQDLIHKFIIKSREKKLPITPQKIEIFTYIASTHKHPSAKKIWSEVRDIFPTISFATVYKNLKNFRDLGFLRETEMPDGSKRYEVNTKPHHHLINLDNGQIFDLDIAEVKPVCNPQISEKLEIIKTELTFFVRNKK